MGGSFTPELTRLLSEAGCRFERQGKGDHEIWFSPHTGIRFPVDHKINQVPPYRECGPQAGWASKALLTSDVASPGDRDLSLARAARAT